MNPSSNSVNWQIRKQAYKFCKRWDKKGEKKFVLFIYFVFGQQPIYGLHESVIDRYIDKRRDKCSWKSELHTLEQFEFIISNRGDDKCECTMVRVFASFKTCGDCIDRIQNGVTDPVSECWYECDCHLIIGFVRDFELLSDTAIFLNYI